MDIKVQITEAPVKGEYILTIIRGNASSSIILSKVDLLYVYNELKLFINKLEGNDIDNLDLLVLGNDVENKSTIDRNILDVLTAQYELVVDKLDRLSASLHKKSKLKMKKVFKWIILGVISMFVIIGFYFIYTKIGV